MKQTWAEENTLVIDHAMSRIAEEMHRDYSSYLEKITEDQFRKILVEIIKSGDIIKYTRPNQMGMTYVPFRREQELLGRIAELEEGNKQVRFYTKQ